MKLQRTPIIIISTLTLLLVGVGVFWYEKAQWTKSQEDQNESADVTIPANKPSASDPQAEQEQVWYQIPELGIEIQLPKDIADDLVYEYKESPITEFVNGKWVPIEGEFRKSALFSTKTLVNLDSENCSIGYSPAGRIARDEGVYSKNMSKVFRCKQFSDFYVYYVGSQAACTEDVGILDYNSKVMVSLMSAFDREIDSKLGRVREIKK